MSGLEPRRIYLAKTYANRFNQLLWLTEAQAKRRNKMFTEDNYIFVTYAVPLNIVVKETIDSRHNVRALKGEDGKLYKVFLSDMSINEITEEQLAEMDKKKIKLRGYSKASTG